jgi:hypothetical protein
MLQFCIDTLLLLAHSIPAGPAAGLTVLNIQLTLCSPASVAAAAGQLIPAGSAAGFRGLCGAQRCQACPAPHSA